MTKGNVTKENKRILEIRLKTTSALKRSKKRKILSDLNTKPVETRAAKRKRLNVSKEDRKFETKSILSVIKKEQKVDEVDTASDDALGAELVASLSILKTPNDIPDSGNLASDTLNMKALMTSFPGGEPDHFFKHCRKFMTNSTMSSTEILTVDQADTPLWFEMRYGRITASRIHQASRCKTKNGSLVDSIMGKRVGWSFAMQRGTKLEGQVFEILKKEMALQGHHLKQCGLFLTETLPHFGASPDGIAKDFVVEIKCPATTKTHSEYISVDTLNPKYLAQIQLQMHITKRKKALLGVADLNFEHNKKVTKVWIDYDEEYVQNLIDCASDFWIQAVYPLLKRKHSQR